MTTATNSPEDELDAQIKPVCKSVTRGGTFYTDERIKAIRKQADTLARIDELKKLPDHHTNILGVVIHGRLRKDYYHRIKELEAQLTSKEEKEDE